LNCRADPADYACPTTNPDGSRYADAGGAILDWAMPDCYGYAASDCEALIVTVATDAHNQVPTFSVTTVATAAQDPSILPGGVISQSIAAMTVGAPHAIAFTANPDPMNGFSGSGGYGGSGGPPPSSTEEQCSFEEWEGLAVSWHVVAAEDPHAYEEACDEAWAAARAAGLLDATNQPVADWWMTAEVAIPGRYLRDPAVLDALTADGSAISSWAKVKSPRFNTQHGEAELHGYKNLITGNFNPYDWKVVFVAPF
jgi:hypothetical protein